MPNGRSGAQQPEPVTGWIVQLTMVLQGAHADHRARFDDSRLITLEIELNQRFAAGSEAVHARQALVLAVRQVLVFPSEARAPIEDA